MEAVVARGSLVLLCFSLAAAIGGGLFESIVLAPLWSKSPPASFAIIQPGTGVPIRHARVERPLLHSRDARIPAGATRCVGSPGGRSGRGSESRWMSSRTFVLYWPYIGSESEETSMSL
jgi:hypothetical protein